MAMGDTYLDEPNRSFFGALWKSWQRKRRRDRVRSLSNVRFRLTREGVHYIGILIFIFIGAMLRDINLLILLAGAMIGLLLLQWRFNIRTLIGLTATRRLPRSTHVGTPTEISVRVANPKQWLGAWLVVVEDPLQKLTPSPKRLLEKGVAVVDEVRPANSAASHYQLNFHQRGRFQVGPSTISTRFPLGLGKGMRTLDNAEQITVFPLLGTLKPRIKNVFQQEMHGNALASQKVGLHEADFYGLRPWTTGDSRRWIHWRTTARLGTLSVRQFERQQRQQACVLLDLHGAEQRKLLELDDKVELAISFMATLATGMARYGSDRLAVAVAANENFALPSVQSSTLVENLLERLAVISASPNPDWIGALRGITIPLLSNPHLLVVSTRENQTAQLQQFARDGIASKLFSRIKVTWLNVMSGDLEPYFSWT